MNKTRTITDVAMETKLRRGHKYTVEGTESGYAVCRADGAIAEFLDSAQAHEARKFLQRTKREKMYMWRYL